MTTREKAEKMAPLLKELTMVAVKHCLARHTTDINLSEIQDALRPKLVEMSMDDNEGFMDFAAMATALVIAEFVKHERETEGTFAE